MRLDAPAAASSSGRLPLIDAARGIAVVAMVVYHFSWDLRYFGYISADVENDLGWRVLARGTAGAFLFIMGVSLVLAGRRGFDATRFLRRLAIVAASAAAVTVVTFFLFPDSYVFFGILHNIAVSSALGLLFVRVPVLLVIVAGIFSFWAPRLLAGPVFDHPLLLWLGLGTLWPRSNDFVPLFPWFGVVLGGIAAARLWPVFALDRAPLWATLPSVPRPVLWLGRHSLVIYLLHQPILFGLTFAASEIAPPSLSGFEPAYVRTCVSSCIDSEVDEGICRRTCDCLVERSQALGLWQALMRQSLSPTEEQRYYSLADECRAAAETN